MSLSTSTKYAKKSKSLFRLHQVSQGSAKTRKALWYPTADTTVSDFVNPKDRTPQYQSGRLTRRCRVQVLFFRVSRTVAFSTHCFSASETQERARKAAGASLQTRKNIMVDFWFILPPQSMPRKLPWLCIAITTLFLSASQTQAQETGANSKFWCTYAVSARYTSMSVQWWRCTTKFWPPQISRSFQIWTQTPSIRELASVCVALFD